MKTIKMTYFSRRSEVLAFKNVIERNEMAQLDVTIKLRARDVTFGKTEAVELVITGFTETWQIFWFGKLVEKESRNL